NAADEAVEYLNDAKWALRWRVLAEAQAAADSAWALGKHDMECATVRVGAYLATPEPGRYQEGGWENPENVAEVLRHVVAAAAPARCWGLIAAEALWNTNKTVRYVSTSAFPDVKTLTSAAHALELYAEFSRTLRLDEPKPDSDWSHLGVEALTTAAQAVQHFHFVPESQPSASSQLAQLRTLARSVAGWLSQSPAVREGYFVGARYVSYDDLHQFEERANIFKCKVEWGCFWQEKPEDCVALYRELMSSPVFRYVHNGLWIRELQQPRLTAWNEADRQRLPLVWNNFLQELNSSTNLLLRLEAKAFKFADAQNDQELAAAFADFFDSMMTNREALVAGNVDVLYLGWGVQDLVYHNSSGVATPTKESLEQRYRAEYYSKLEAMHEEYMHQTLPAGKFLAVFQEQNRFLAEKRPYEFFAFARLFGQRNYSKAQALAIQPLLADYKSNLLAQAEKMSGPERGKTRNAASMVASLESSVDRILNPPAPKLANQTNQGGSPTRVPLNPVKTSLPKLAPSPDPVTNILSAKTFLAIPLDSLGGNRISQIQIIAHHWQEGRLLLDLKYSVPIYSYDKDGAWRGTRNPTLSAIAILDPGTGHWEVIDCPERTTGGENLYYHRSALVGGELFTCNAGQICRFDFAKRRWQTLELPEQDNFELFGIEGHLYASNRNMLLEVAADGKTTRILASLRRNPATSALDKLDNLGTPTLFAGPNHSLQVNLRDKTYSWVHEDWREDFAGSSSPQPQVFDAGVLFRTEGRYDRAAALTWRLQNRGEPELCFVAAQLARNVTFSTPVTKPASSAKALWPFPKDLSLERTAAAVHGSNLYCLTDHAETRRIADAQQTVVKEEFLAKDGYHAKLDCFSQGFPSPQALFIKFESAADCPPLRGINSPAQGGFSTLPPSWMVFTTNLLCLGMERPLMNMTQDAQIGCQMGVWTIPISEIEPAFAAQREIQTARMVAEAAAVKNAWQALVAKYDRNHNGTLEPEEKAAALADPAFIEAQLEKFDANYNGILDAEELIYFDVNEDKILDVSEQTAIDTAQLSLAARLLQRFDDNHDGTLDHTEFTALHDIIFGASMRPMGPFSTEFPDDNRDRKVDLGELTSYLEQQIRMHLRPREAPSQPRIEQMKGPDSGFPSPRQMFKGALEYYWQNPASFTNGTPRTIHP
ncbi:MAG: Calcium-binding EF-hand-containing protein, partial [Pedosphaera sp.]|nr:Calcium-binding EF-hand-containing protein [Pedosphaera sp.]